MKKKNIVEEIAIAMMCTAKYALREEEIVSDANILTKISAVSDLEATDRDGRTLLINAVFYGRKAVAEYLLNKGANVNAQDKAGFSALHAAAQNGETEIAALLLSQGADVNARDCYGNNPLMRCDHRGPLGLFELLLSHGANPTLENNYGITALQCFSAYPAIMALLTKDGCVVQYTL